MKFSTSIEYAVHALVYLARIPAGTTALLADVAGVIKVPESYLRKVFQLLAKKRIVATQRGAKGGVRLGRLAAEVSLRDVVEAVDGALPFYSCQRDHRGCAVAEACPVKGAFDEAGRRMAETLEATTIGSLAGKLARRTTRWLAVRESA